MGKEIEKSYALVLFACMLWSPGEVLLTNNWKGRRIQAVIWKVGLIDGGDDGWWTRNRWRKGAGLVSLRG